MNDVLALYPASRRERRKARNRKALLSAAKKLFAERGHQSVGIREIADAADFASGTFYNYFDSLDQLKHEVANDTAHAFKMYLDENATGTSTLEERIEAAYRAFFDYTLAERSESGAPLGVFLVGQASPGATNIVEQAKLYIQDTLAEFELDETTREVSAAMAIGTARELALRHAYSNQSEADMLAAKAAKLFMASLTKYEPPTSKFA